MIDFLENVTQFLESHKDLLNRYDFDELYNEAHKTTGDEYVSISGMTSIFLEAGLNPLQYMSRIPDFYFESNKAITSIEIPNNITSIGNNAFDGCKGLTNIVIPDSVTEISDYAFASCENLKTIILSENLKSLPYCVFYDCKSLTRVVIPNSVTTIANAAFAKCEKLTDILIQNNITTLGSDVFNYCKSLTNIRFNGTKKEWKDIAKSPLWKRHSNIKTIECKDGIIKY